MAKARVNYLFYVLLACACIANDRSVRMHSFTISCLVMLGSGLGGLSRYWLGEWSKTWLNGNLVGLPLGTIVVNVLGSGAIAWLTVYWADKDGLKLLACVGFMGGFTTFSSFSRETIELVQQGRYGWAISYVSLSVVVCLAAAALGYYLGRLSQST